jgi:cytochrome c-type biogenesis protein CcmE
MMASIAVEHPTRARRRTLKPLHWMMLGIVALALGFGGWSLQGSLTRESTIAEAKQTDGTVLVYGWLHSKGQYDSAGRWTFDIQDNDGSIMTVVSNEGKPGNFDDAIGVSAVGQYNTETGAFEADNLLVKCPSKYQEAQAQAAQ